MKNKQLTIIVIIVATILFYMQNVAVPFFTDDIGFLFKTDHELLDSLSDIVEKVKSEYFNLHGRLLANFYSHFIVVCLGEYGFNVANALCFLLLILVSIRYLRLKSDNVLGVVLIVLGYTLVSDTYSNLFLWGVGAGNYMWPLLGVIGCLALQQSFGKVHNKLLKALLILLVAFFSISNEAFLLPLCFGYFFHFVFALFKRSKLDRTELMFFIAYVTATAFLMFSPGTLHRAANAYTTINAMEILKRIAGIAFSIRVFYVILVLSVYRFIQDRQRFFAFIRSESFILIMVFAGMIPAVLSGGKGRVLITTEIFSLFLLVKYVSSYHISRNSSAVVGLFSVFIIYQTFVMYDNCHLWNGYNKAVKQYLQSAPDKGLVEYDDTYRPYPFTAYSRLNINETLESFLTVGRLQKLKAIETGGDDVMPIQLLPLSVKSAIDKGVFTASNLVPGTARVYTTTDIDYYLLPYDKKSWDDMMNGGFLKLARFAIWEKLSLVVNYDRDDMTTLARPATHVVHKDVGDIIIINKSFKDYPLFKVTEINLSDKFSGKKFNLQIK